MKNEFINKFRIFKKNLIIKPIILSSWPLWPLLFIPIHVDDQYRKTQETTLYSENILEV